MPLVEDFLLYIGRDYFGDLYLFLDFVFLLFWLFLFYLHLIFQSLSIFLPYLTHFFSVMPHKHSLPNSRPSEGLLNGAIFYCAILNHKRIADLFSTIYCKISIGLIACQLFGDQIVEDVSKSVICSLGY